MYMCVCKHIVQLFRVTGTKRATFEIILLRFLAPGYFFPVHYKPQNVHTIVYHICSHAQFFVTNVSCGVIFSCMAKIIARAAQSCELEQYASTSERNGT